MSINLESRLNHYEAGLQVLLLSILASLLASCNLADMGKLEPLARQIATDMANRENVPVPATPTPPTLPSGGVGSDGGGSSGGFEGFATPTEQVLKPDQVKIDLQVLKGNLCAILEGSNVEEGQQVKIPRSDNESTVAITALSIINVANQIQACFDGQGGSDNLTGVRDVTLKKGFTIFDPKTGMALVCKNNANNINVQTCEQTLATPTPNQ